MGEIQHLLKVYKSYLSDRVKDLAKPLDIYFGIDEFIYTKIGEKGDFFVISNQPGPSEFYFSSQFYEATLLIRHPDNFCQQALMPVMIPQEKQESQMYEKFGYSPDNLLALFKKGDHCVHKFLFNTKKKVNLIPFYLNNLSMLDCFCESFLKEWSDCQREMEKYIINIGELIGKDFYKIDPLIQEKDLIAKKLAFLKKIGVLPKDFFIPSLTTQEKNCLRWIHQGKTLKETALEMVLSPRTVEYYFENIKNKLDCNTKSEVIEKLEKLTQLGVL